MIQIRLVSEDDKLVMLKTIGRVVPDGPQPDNEPIAKTLGVGAYGRRVLLSLEESDYMDSSGVGWLLVCHKRFREAGGILVIHSTPKMIYQMIKLLRLDSVLHVAPDLAAARTMALAEKPA